MARLLSNDGVVRSWFLESAQRLLERDSSPEALAPEVGGSETGCWTVEAPLEAGIPFSNLSLALFRRYGTRRDSFAAGW